MTSEYAQELDVARAAAAAASEILLAAWRTPQEVREKAPHDAEGGSNPVTDADEAADRAIRAIVRARFPDDGWLSEETKDDPSRLAKRRVWVVDPMDGTKDFLDGRPEFAVSIALVENGAPVVAWLDVPAVGDSYGAMIGRGAMRVRGGLRDRIRAASPGAVGSAPHLAVSRSESGKGLFAGWESSFALDPGGSIARKLCLAAEGSADGAATIRPRSEWDVAAGVLVAKEAGCLVTLHDGAEIVFNRADPRLATGLAAAPPWCHARILERIAG